MSTSSKPQPQPQLPPELAEVQQPVYLRMSKIVSYMMYGWVMLGAAALTLRTFLLLFSANTAAPFVRFVMRMSDDYLRPFRGIFPARQVGESGYLDVAALFAIIVYLVLAWLVGALISYVQVKIDDHDKEERRKLYYLQVHGAEQNDNEVDSAAHRRRSGERHVNDR